MLVIAVVAVAVLAAGGTGLAVALGSGGRPHRAPGRVTVIRFPRSLLGFRGNGTGDMQRLTTRDGSLTKVMFAGPIRNALYGPFPPGLMVVAGQWSAAGRASFRHTGQVPFEKSVLAGLFAAGDESFPAGPRDGRQACGSITSHGPRMIACVWADSTMVWAVVYEWSVSSLSDAAARTIEVRAACELPPAGSRSPSASQ